MNAYSTLGPLVIVAGLLGACAADPARPQPPPPLASSRASPAADKPVSSTPPPASTVTPEGWRIQGGQLFTPPPAATFDRRGQTLSFTFDRAPIAVVADAVFGQALRKPFRVDPDVSGTVTLRIAGYVTEADAVRIVDTALRPSGAAVIADGAGYAIVPVAKASVLTKAPLVGGQGAPQFTGGVVIYPAQNTSAAELLRLLTPLAGSSAQVRIDSAREHVYLSGDPTTVNALLRTAQMFDVDWMRGMSFQFFPLRYASPKEMSDELRKLTGGPDGPVGSQIDFIEVDRLNGLIVMAKTAKRLDDVQVWIERLDQPSPTPRRRLRSIPLANLSAEPFVKVLSGLLGEEGSPQAGAGTPSAAGAPSLTGAAGLAGGLRLTADPRSNSILMLADDAEYANVRAIVDEMDSPPAQVLIEATVAEVTLNDQLKFGVQWFFENGSTTGGFGSVNSSAAASSYPGLSVRYVGGDFRAVLNSLSSVTDVRLMSTPRVLVLSNETATLQVGDQVPIITQQSSGTTTDSRIINSVQYRDTGVVLTVTPRVGDQGRMFIDIDQQVSEVSTTTSSDIDSPTIQQRRFTTKIQVEDGQVVALGGLFRDVRSVGDTGVPYLSRAPVIGSLFRSRDTSTRQTELVIFLRTTLVRSRSDADRVTDEIGSRLDRLSPRRGTP
jgi:general secretion pathway protein D